MAATSSHRLTEAGEVCPFETQLRRQLKILTFKVKEKKGESEEDRGGKKTVSGAAGGNVLFQLWRSVEKSFDSR